jgi:glycerate 2-kinase
MTRPSEAITGKADAVASAAGRRLRQDALDIFQNAVEESAPERTLPSRVRWSGKALRGEGFRLDLAGRTLVLSYGKASASMARALAAVLAPGKMDGFIVLPQGERRPRIEGMRSLAASHPVPDAGSFLAGRLLLERTGRAGRGDTVIHLISGGGSALLASPLEGLITAREKTCLHRLLVGSALGIREINLVRKHFSGIKGGRLILRAPQARHLSLITSDVPAGFPEAVAGGPTLPDRSGWAECLRILRDSGILGELPAALRRRLLLGRLPEPPQPADPIFRTHRWAVLASGEDLVDAAARRARQLGYRVAVLSPTVEEPAERALDRFLAKRVRLEREGKSPFCIVGGGEVRVESGRRPGLGGRAQDLAAAAAIRLEGKPASLFLAAGSDGIDGNSPAAGAMADGETVLRARRAGIDIRASRRRRDTFRLFTALGDGVMTGRTGTNLRDLYLLLASPGAAGPVRGASGDRRG